MTPFVFKTMKEEDCKIYSDELFTFHAKNKTKHDNRCPGSDALYGAPKHKEIHEELALKLSSVINIRLAPTFVYSRIYRPGEILYPHTDRAECEYTASLTLDYSDNKEDFTRTFKELSVKWIGREAVIQWLVSNQILFEVISHDFLPEEREALGEVFEETKSVLKPNLLN